MQSPQIGNCQNYIAIRYNKLVGNPAKASRIGRSHTRSGGRSRHCHSTIAIHTTTVDCSEAGLKRRRSVSCEAMGAVKDLVMMAASAPRFGMATAKSPSDNLRSHTSLVWLLL